jgi:hypothetical protein
MSPLVGSLACIESWSIETKEDERGGRRKMSPLNGSLDCITQRIIVFLEIKAHDLLQALLDDQREALPCQLVQAPAASSF